MATDMIGESIRVGRECGQDHILNFYDEWAKAGTYEQIFEDAGYRGHIAIAFLLSEHIANKVEKILDIGAGSGLVGEQLDRIGFTNIYAVDPSQESLKACMKKGIYKECINSFVGPVQLPFEENSFAGAGSSAVFLTGHCDGTSLREVVRLVKPGGTIVIATRKTFYDDHHDNFNFRAVSDELVSAKVCSLAFKEIPDYNQGDMGWALIYTVL